MELNRNPRSYIAVTIIVKKKKTISAVMAMVENRRSDPRTRLAHVMKGINVTVTRPKPVLTAPKMSGLSKCGTVWPFVCAREREKGKAKHWDSHAVGLMFSCLVNRVYGRTPAKACPGTFGVFSLD